MFRHSVLQVKPLIWIESVIERHSHSRVEYMIKVIILLAYELSKQQTQSKQHQQVQIAWFEECQWADGSCSARGSLWGLFCDLEKSRDQPSTKPIQITLVCVEVIQYFVVLIFLHRPKASSNAAPQQTMLRYTSLFHQMLTPPNSRWEWYSRTSIKRPSIKRSPIKVPEFASLNYCTLDLHLMVTSIKRTRSPFRFPDLLISLYFTTIKRSLTRW